MSTKCILFAGTASCVLALAAPAIAQNASYGSWQNGPQYSTPAEQEQTRQLNEQAAQGSAQSPAQNAQYEQQSAPPQDNGNYEQPANGNAQVQYDDSRQPSNAQYDQEQQQYNQQQNE